MKEVHKSQMFAPWLVDADHQDMNAAIAAASQQRAWIFRDLSDPYGSRSAVLYYWPNTIGDGHPIGLWFRNVTEARSFYQLNINSDHPCAECFSKPMVTGSRYCGECKRLLDKLSELRARYDRAQDMEKRRLKMWEEIQRIGKAVDVGEATDADKAAVLDQLMRDVTRCDESAIEGAEMKS